MITEEQAEKLRDLISAYAESLEKFVFCSDHNPLRMTEVASQRLMASRRLSRYIDNLKEKK